MFDNKSKNKNDLDGFWDDLIEKSNWAKKNSGKSSGGFKNLEILDAKPVKSNKTTEDLNITKTGRPSHKKMIAILSIVLSIILLILLFFIVKVWHVYSSDTKCDAGVWSISKRECVKMADYCNKKFAINSVYSDNGCHCLEGYVQEGGSCVKQKDCSRLGNVYIGANNICKCADGYIMQDDKCVSYYEDCSQKNGFFDGEINQKNNKHICKCKANNFWNAEKNKCESCGMLKDKGLDTKNQCQIMNKTTSTDGKIDIQTKN